MELAQTALERPPNLLPQLVLLEGNRDLVKGEPPDHLRQAEQRRSVLVERLGQVLGRTQETGQHLGPDFVDRGGADDHPRVTAGLPKALADQREVLVLDRVTGAVGEALGDVLPAGAKLPVEVEEPEVVLVGPLVFGKAGLEVMLPPA